MATKTSIGAHRSKTRLVRASATVSTATGHQVCCLDIWLNRGPTNLFSQQLQSLSIFVISLANRPGQAQVKVSGGIAPNHACGCTKCRKPEGTPFSVVAVPPSDSVTGMENGHKLAVVDASAVVDFLATWTAKKVGILCA
jgi:hypothetical protein